MPVFAFDLSPGQWYIMITCEKCKQKHVLFPDLSQGKSKLKASYQWTCRSCGHRGEYDAEALERYQHPATPDAAE